jgi:hypothetical protein
MIGNVVIVELMIVVTGSFLFSKKVSQNLIKYRRDIYMGLIVSNIP